MPTTGGRVLDRGHRHGLDLLLTLVFIFDIHNGLLLRQSLLQHLYTEFFITSSYNLPQRPPLSFGYIIFVSKMRVSLSTIVVAALATLASAQSAQPNGPNPFSIPSSGLSFVAGTPAQISWTPTTSGTVTILLRKGPSGSLDAGTVIASEFTSRIVYEGIGSFR